VIGLGPGSPRHLTVEARSYLASGNPLYLRTLKHPAARYVAARSEQARSFDYLYDQGSSFEEVYRTITRILLKQSKQHNLICYAVPGHPNVGEATVERLKRIAPRLGVEIKLVAGLSFLEPLLSQLQLDLLDGVTVLDALTIEKMKEPALNHLILAQVYNKTIASRVKLKLLELYPDHYPVLIVNAAGMTRAGTKRTRLCALDHHDLFDHYTTLYLSPFKGGSIGDLIELMARLRAPDGCPWDRKQDHLSLRQYLIEEAYEVVAAIDSGNDREIIDELGDLLLQVIFHSQIGREENRFDFNDVVEAISKKLIRRHPHVFGSRNAVDADAVKVLWEEMKSVERDEDQHRFSLQVDEALPALLRAFKIQKKAAKVGFDWPTIGGPLEKAREELSELEEACNSGSQDAVEEELGDFLFTLVNLARFLKVNPELALGRTTGKFIARFSYIMEQVVKSGKEFNEFSLEQLDQWWDEAKKSGK
jgi:tetrapyrrole methylase family protein / MazG family protein